MPRSVLALTGIVAVVAISLGIKDYVQQKGAKPRASASTATVVDSKALTVPRKSRSAKTRRAEMSATGANAPAHVADDMEKPLISGEYSTAGAKAERVVDSASNTPKAQPTHNEVEAAMDRNRLCSEFEKSTVSRVARPALSPAQFLLLPNLTKPGDVDAAYYQNWAREYCEFVAVETKDRRQ